MSKLYVNEIVEATAGASVKLPAGSVLQSLTHRVDGNITVSGTSWVDTGLTLTITPKFANSKLELSLIGGRPYFNTNLDQIDVRFADASGTALGGKRITSLYTNSATSWHPGPWSGFWIQDASDTSTRTYKVQMNFNDSGTGWFNNGSDISVHFNIKEISQ